VVWLKPAIATALVMAMGAIVVSVVHFRQHEAVRTEQTAQAKPPAIAQEKRVQVAPVAPSFSARRLTVRHPKSELMPPGSTRQMTMRLPYSNNAIENGTGTTIHVSMSQSELLSLGFPINATVQDRRIAAELTLGDDGLPRAISLPLPLEVVKERR
jgi:hypothetical protein